jgi:hypothetical protein
LRELIANQVPVLHERPGWRGRGRKRLPNVQWRSLYAKAKKLQDEINKKQI